MTAIFNHTIFKISRLVKLNSKFLHSLTVDLFHASLKIPHHAQDMQNIDRNIIKVNTCLLMSVLVFFSICPLSMLKVKMSLSS